MSYVFVIDTDKQLLSPVHPGRARLLLKGGKAAVYRRYPFTLILKHKVDKPVPAPLRLKQDIRDFLADQPDRLCHVLTQTKVPLKDATVVNVTRSELLRRLQAIGLSLETGSGGRTKYNRIMRGLPKTHWTDAACVVVGIGGPGGEATLAGFGVSPNSPIPQRVLGFCTRHGKITDVPHRFCQPIHRSDGYTYHHGVRISPPPTSPKGAPVSTSTC